MICLRIYVEKVLQKVLLGFLLLGRFRLHEWANLFLEDLADFVGRLWPADGRLHVVDVHVARLLCSFQTEVIHLMII